MQVRFTTRMSERAIKLFMIDQERKANETGWYYSSPYVKLCSLCVAFEQRKLCYAKRHTMHISFSYNGITGKYSIEDETLFNLFHCATIAQKVNPALWDRLYDLLPSECHMTLQQLTQNEITEVKKS